MRTCLIPLIRHGGRRHREIGNLLVGCRRLCLRLRLCLELPRVCRAAHGVAHIVDVPHMHVTRHVSERRAAVDRYSRDSVQPIEN